MYLDPAQPLLSVVCNLASARHWTALLRVFSFVHGVGGNDRIHCRNLELILKFNFGEQQVIRLLAGEGGAGGVDNIVFPKLLQQKGLEVHPMKRNKDSVCSVKHSSDK